MNYTYSGDPTTSDGDRVRFLTGDAETGNMQLTDEEIEAVLGLSDQNVDLAAAFAAEAIANKYARKADKSVGDLRISYGQLSKNYSDMAARLRSRAALEGAPPYAGGISIADKEASLFTDAEQPVFRIGMHDR